MSLQRHSREACCGKHDDPAAGLCRGGMEYGKGVLSVGGGNMLVLKAPVTGDAFFITTQSLPELISSISG